MQLKQDVSTFNYISIFILTFVAFSGTAYLIYYAINSPPFDVEVSIALPTEDSVQCVNNELIKRNIPYENTEHRETDWIVLRNIEDKEESQSILLNECAASR